MQSAVLKERSAGAHLSAAPALPLILLAHGHPLLSQGLAVALAECGAVQRVPSSAVVSAPEASPGVLLVTDRASAMGCHASLAQAVPVLVVDFGVCGREVRRLLDSGVQGCVRADCELLELSRAVQALSRGEVYLCPQCAAALADDVVLAGFTPREEEVLALICEGLDNKRIAQRLGLALSTVKTHVRALLAKSGASNRTNIATSILRRTGG